MHQSPFISKDRLIKVSVINSNSADFLPGAPSVLIFFIFDVALYILLMMAEKRQRDHSSESIQNDSTKQQKEISLKMQLEGECKITEIKLLTFSYIKTVLLLIPFILSVVGLFILKYSKSLRAMVFYWPAQIQLASHIFIKGNSKKQQQIMPIFTEGQIIYFFYKKLKYQLLGGRAVPMALNYEQQLKTKLELNYLTRGLDDQQIQERRALYGNNTHIVDPPQYYEYLYEVMTEPFFFIQYLAAVIYIIQRLPELSILLLGSSVITTSINYILLYISYRKIKEIAEKVVQIEVIRNGSLQTIPSSLLVPGDIFIPKDELYCDVILLQGEIYVNEANLTGQSVPIGKFALQSYKHWTRGDNSKWIYEGSEILSSQNPIAMVIHTGYSSKRGRILRKILHRTQSVPHFFMTCIYFLAEMYAVAVILYLGTMKMRIDNNNLDPIIIFLNFLLLVTFCFSPALPIYFNLVYSFCLMRLKWKNILGTEPQKTIEAAHLQIMCFDKTGTLTEDKVQVTKVLKFKSRQAYQITDRQQQSSGMDFKIFGSCHTVRYFNKDLLGDEIDLKIFGHSGYKLIDSKEQTICFQVQTISQNKKYNKIRILKIFQYQSKFQSMSVLAFDFETNKYYIFVKGAPEKIHYNSKIKYHYFDTLLQEVSYGGFRSIAYGYKQIKESEVKYYLEQSRENYLKDINILGLVVLENKLKDDAHSTIQLLEDAGIESRMITGDNIYIAIETAIRCGIISRKSEIMVLEGNQQNLPADVPENQIRLHAKIFNFEQKKVNIQKQQISFREYINSSIPIVIDNDFLKIRDDLSISPKIRVYARISPENKALIVRKIKQEIRKKRKSMTRCEKILSEEVNKVGMVGDGANDLLAIKESDIGIGIRNCDSSYAASFSVQKLTDIDEIVRQAKCGEKQIIQICRFVAITGFLSVPVLIIMETEASYFSSWQLIFGNITKYLLFPIILALSKPSAKTTVYKPCSNFLKPQHQLVVWGNVILATAAHVGIMVYFRTTSEYVWNTTRATLQSGWVSSTPLVTAQYLFVSFHPVILVFCLHQSEPWKETINKNILLFLAFLLNLLFSDALFFLVPLITDFLDFVTITYSTLAFLYMISVVTGIAILIYNGWITCMKFHQRQIRMTMPQREPCEMINSETNNQHR